MDIKNLFFGIFFFIASISCLATWIIRGYESYLVVGTIVFFIVGLAYIKRLRPYK